MVEGELQNSERQLENGGTETEACEARAAHAQRTLELTNRRVLAAKRIAAAADVQVEALHRLTAEHQTLVADQRAARHMAEAAEARAQASEAHFARLVAANLIGIIVVEADRITEANDAFLRLVGHARADLEGGRLCWPAMMPPASALLGEHASAALEELGTCGPFETEYCRADGRRLPVLVGATVLEREPLRWVCCVIDLSTQKQLEREREAAQAQEAAQREVTRHLDEFFATAAHDIRHPVSAAQMSVELARLHFEHLAGALAQGRPTEPVMELMRASLEVAGQSMERLTHLTTMLFDMAQVRHGKLEVQPSLCDLTAVVREQVAMVRLAAPSRVLGMQLPDASPVPVLADADRVGEVLANYLTNALKYSSDDQLVKVHLLVSEGQATVAVQDWGPGLSPEEQRRVWEAFHQASEVAAQSRAMGASSLGLGLGLGLGLHLCKHIIEAHPGGQVGMSSVVGQGSTFWFTLPLVVAQDCDRHVPYVALPEAKGVSPDTGRARGTSTRHVHTPGARRPR